MDDLEWIKKAWEMYFEYGDKNDIDFMDDTMKTLIDIIYQQNKVSYPRCVMCGKVIHIQVYKTDINHNSFYCNECKNELDNYMTSLDNYYNAMNKKEVRKNEF